MDKGELDLDSDFSSSVEPNQAKPECENGAGGSGYKSKYEIVPVVLGLKAKRPALVLLYEVLLGDESRKWRKRYMPLHDFSRTSDVREKTLRLKERHMEALERVPSVLIEKFMRIIQEMRKGAKVDDAVKQIDMEYANQGETEDKRFTTEKVNDLNSSRKKKNNETSNDQNKMNGANSLESIKSPTGTKLPFRKDIKDATKPTELKEKYGAKQVDKKADLPQLQNVKPASRYTPTDSDLDTDVEDELENDDEPWESPPAQNQLLVLNAVEVISNAGPDGLKTENAEHEFIPNNETSLPGDLPSSDSEPKATESHAEAKLDSKSDLIDKKIITADSDASKHEVKQDDPDWKSDERESFNERHSKSEDSASKKIEVETDCEPKFVTTKVQPDSKSADGSWIKQLLQLESDSKSEAKEESKNSDAVDAANPTKIQVEIEQIPDVKKLEEAEEADYDLKSELKGVGKNLGESHSDIGIEQESNDEFQADNSETFESPLPIFHQLTREQYLKPIEIDFASVSEDLYSETGEELGYSEAEEIKLDLELRNLATIKIPAEDDNEVNEPEASDDLHSDCELQEAGKDLGEIHSDDKIEKEIRDGLGTENMLINEDPSDMGLNSKQDQERKQFEPGLDSVSEELEQKHSEVGDELVDSEVHENKRDLELHNSEKMKIPSGSHQNKLEELEGLDDLKPELEIGKDFEHSEALESKHDFVESEADDDLKPEFKEVANDLGEPHFDIEIEQESNDELQVDNMETFESPLPLFHQLTEDQYLKPVEYDFASASEELYSETGEELSYSEADEIKLDLELRNLAKMKIPEEDFNELKEPEAFDDDLHSDCELQEAGKDLGEIHSDDKIEKKIRDGLGMENMLINEDPSDTGLNSKQDQERQQFEPGLDSVSEELEQKQSEVGDELVQSDVHENKRDLELHNSEKMKIPLGAHQNKLEELEGLDDLKPELEIGKDFEYSEAHERKHAFVEPKANDDLKPELKEVGNDLGESHSDIEMEQESNDELQVENSETFESPLPIFHQLTEDQYLKPVELDFASASEELYSTGEELGYSEADEIKLDLELRNLAKIKISAEDFNESKEPEACDYDSQFELNQSGEDHAGFDSDVEIEKEVNAGLQTEDMGIIENPSNTGSNLKQDQEWKQLKPDLDSASEELEPDYSDAGDKLMHDSKGELQTDDMEITEDPSNTALNSKQNQDLKQLEFHHDSGSEKLEDEYSKAGDERMYNENNERKHGLLFHNSDKMKIASDEPKGTNKKLLSMEFELNDDDPYKAVVSKPNLDFDDKPKPTYVGYDGDRSHKDNRFDSDLSDESDDEMGAPKFMVKLRESEDELSDVGRNAEDAEYHSDSEPEKSRQENNSQYAVSEDGDDEQNLLLENGGNLGRAEDEPKQEGQEGTQHEEPDEYSFESDFESEITDPDNPSESEHNNANGEEPASPKTIETKKPLEYTGWRKNSTPAKLPQFDFDTQSEPRTDSECVVDDEEESFGELSELEMVAKKPSELKKAEYFVPQKQIEVRKPPDAQGYQKRVNSPVADEKAVDAKTQAELKEDAEEDLDVKPAGSQKYNDHDLMLKDKDTGNNNDEEDDFWK